MVRAPHTPPGRPLTTTPRRALLPPGYHADWHLALRSTTGARELVAFIAGVPLTLRIRQASVVPRLVIRALTRASVLQTCATHFLAVHSAWRARRLAPALHAELTRRSRRRGVPHIFYTTARQFPRVLAETQCVPSRALPRPR